MTTHELARKLLERPDETVVLCDAQRYYTAEPTVIAGLDEQGSFTGLAALEAGSRNEAVWYYRPIRP